MQHIDNSLPDSKTPVKDVIHNHNSADSSDKSGKDERQFHAEDVTAMAMLLFESILNIIGHLTAQTNDLETSIGVFHEISVRKHFRLAEIMEGMQQFAKVSCIRFEPKRDDDVDYVYIYPLTTVCGSKIGRVGGEQALVLSPRCSNKRTILHEMMHAIGFHHEHNRADRDDYVDINERFIQPGAEDEFKKRTLDEIDHLGMEYDYSSIMHYGKRTFAAGRWPPMWPKKNGVEIGNKQEFSETDIKKINIYYECPQEAPPHTPEPDPACVDEVPYCEPYFRICGEYPDDLGPKCKKTCELCGKQKRKSYEFVNTEYVGQNCKKMKTVSKFTYGMIPLISQSPIASSAPNANKIEAAKDFYYQNIVKQPLASPLAQASVAKANEPRVNG
ncbi:unnamed protein product [Toxocara canis]|uniref:Metalloendopeptidase n=1 Tax=Toxocara canis TaxID=6265 RepID=A0A3P7EY86_TOXCA|nr:unnamed protein product [Toxocara canis]